MPCSSKLTHLYFFDEWHGFVFGDKGVILETFSGGVVSVDENPFVENRKVLNSSPNPFRSEINIDITDFKNSTNLTVNLYSTAGQLMLHEQKQYNAISNKLRLNLSMLKPGVYVCRIFDGELVGNCKLIKIN